MACSKPARLSAGFRLRMASRNSLSELLHTRDGVGIDASGTADIDPLGEAVDFGLECFNRAARHGFGQARADLGEIATQLGQRPGEIRCWLAQRLDLGGDIAQMGLEADRSGAGAGGVQT